MIYVNDKTITESEFITLLENTRINIEEYFSSTKANKKISGVDFEDIVYKKMLECSVNSVFEGAVVQTGAHGFPDIIAQKYFGVEVKMTVGDKWISTGNSVLEGTRIDGVERIYLLFGKFGAEFAVRYRLYQDCLYDVGVTHSPRYKINMELAEGHSIFSKIGIEYDIFRNEENPIKRLKGYYKNLLKEGEELWWIDQNNGESEEAVSPIIKPFRSLNKEDKSNFRIAGFVFFPEVFSSSTLKFERFAIYLITRHNIVSSNQRDLFTGAGQMPVTFQNGITHKVPKILFHLFKNAKAISERINTEKEQDLIDYWKVNTIDENRITQWKNLIVSAVNNSESSSRIIEVFEEGLKV